MVKTVKKQKYYNCCTVVHRIALNISSSTYSLTFYRFYMFLKSSILQKTTIIKVNLT